jgi:ferredoxin
VTLIATVDSNACSAHGDCEDLAPEIFRLDGVAQIIGDGPDDLMLGAAEACPSVAIRIVDRDSGEQVYP